MRDLLPFQMKSQHPSLPNSIVLYIRTATTPLLFMCSCSYWISQVACVLHSLSLLLPWVQNTGRAVTCSITQCTQLPKALTLLGVASCPDSHLHCAVDTARCKQNVVARSGFEPTLRREARRTWSCDLLLRQKASDLGYLQVTGTRTGGWLA